MSPSELRALIEAAEARRGALPHEAVRLFDGAADGLPRLIIERFGDAVRLSGGREKLDLLEPLREIFAHRALFWRFGHDAQGGPTGDDGRRIVNEAGLRYGVQLLGHRNTGLFLDGRPARAWVRAHAEGRRVLNLFSFTCPFGVAAAAGGARATTNVDGVPGVLKRGRENYALNDLPFDGRSFWRSDVLSALSRAHRSGGRFDGIILDPPPVKSGAHRGRRGRRTDVTEHLGRLAGACRDVLDPGGWLLVLVASWRLSDEAILEAVDMGEPIWRGTSGDDFRAADGQPKLRALAFT